MIVRMNAGPWGRETRMADKRKRTKKSGNEETRQHHDASSMTDPPKVVATEERVSASALAPPPKKRAPRKRAAAKPAPEQEVGIESSVEEPTVARTSSDLPKAEIDRLLAGEQSNPHAILRAHPMSLLGESGVMIRALIPNAERVECVLENGEVVPMTREATGISDIYSTFVSGATLPLSYRFRFHYADGATWDRADA